MARSAGFAQGYHSGGWAGAGFPEFTRFCNHGFPWKLQSRVNLSVAISARVHALYSRLLYR
jgi:hypothetical protein